MAKKAAILTISATMLAGYSYADEALTNSTAKGNPFVVSTSISANSQPSNSALSNALQQTIDTNSIDYRMARLHHMMSNLRDYRKNPPIPAISARTNQPTLDEMLEHIRQFELDEEIENYNDRYYHIDQIVTRHGGPLRVKCAITNYIEGEHYSMDPLMIRQKFYTQLENAIDFSDSKPAGMIRLSYTVMNGDSLKLSNSFIGEFIPNSRVIRIDAVYTDFRHNEISKCYVEGNLNSISSMLEELTLRMLQGVNGIERRHSE